MNNGWAKIHRSIEDNPLYFSEPFTKAQAWIDLFTFANHAEGIVSIRGNIVQLKRGQIGWSEITMTKRWKWSRNKVRRFLKYLETEQQIEQQKYLHITTIITIVNYDKYQQMEQQTIQQKDNRRYINKKNKKKKNIYIQDNDLEESNKEGEQERGSGKKKRERKKPEYKPVDLEYIESLSARFPSVDIAKFWEDVKLKQAARGVKIVNERATLVNWLSNDEKWSKERQKQQGKPKEYTAVAVDKNGQEHVLRSNAPITPGAYFSEYGLVTVK